MAFVGFDQFFRFKAVHIFCSTKPCFGRLLIFCHLRPPSSALRPHRRRSSGASDSVSTDSPECLRSALRIRSPFHSDIFSSNRSKRCRMVLQHVYLYNIYIWLVMRGSGTSIRDAKHAWPEEPRGPHAVPSSPEAPTTCDSIPEKSSHPKLPETKHQ